MKLGVGASDRVEKDEDSPFLRICYPGYCTLGFVPRKQKKAFGAFTEAPNSKTSSRNPPKCYNLYSASIQKQSLFPQLNVLWQYFLKNCTLVGHSALPLQLLSLQYGFVSTKISLHIIIIVVINGITEYLLSKDLVGPQGLYIV